MCGVVIAVVLEIRGVLNWGCGMRNKDSVDEKRDGRMALGE